VKVISKNKHFKNKRGQIWIETVLYTLIALVLIGLVLAFAVPRIQEAQDKSVIEQSLDVLEEIDLIISELGGPGNQRRLYLKISKGEFVINGTSDSLFFNLESKHEYSEEGLTIKIGSVDVITERNEGAYKVKLTKDYSSRYNITYNAEDITEKISRASTPYNIIVSNRGLDSSSRIIINLEIV